MHPITMYRGSIWFFLIVAQLSAVSGTLNVEQITTSSSDPSSLPPLFPGPDDSVFTENIGLPSPEDLMVPFNNGGNFELASGGNNCAPGHKRRGERRARRDDQTFCPNNPQVRQIAIRKAVGSGTSHGILLTGLRYRLSHHPIRSRKQDNNRAVRKDRRPRLKCNRRHQKYQGRKIQTKSSPQSRWKSWTSRNPIPVFAPGE